METVILIIVALAGLGAFAVGSVLLILYFRYSRAEGRSHDEPVVYGNLVQCPACGYMNPSDAAACLNCRQPFAVPRRQPQPAPPVPAPRPMPAVPAESTVAANPPPRPIPAAAPLSRDPSVMPRAWLEGIGGPMIGHRALLTQADILVGRSTACDVQVYDPKVSRKHFLIRYANGAFFLQDQQSSRGTRINGERVLAQRLNDGDRIELGDSSMIFHIE